MIQDQYIILVHINLACKNTLLRRYAFFIFLNKENHLTEKQQLYMKCILKTKRIKLNLKNYHTNLDY